MIVHELGTNALKYGAFSAGDGTVEVSWTRDADGLSVVWRESGGPPVSPPQNPGLGLRVLASGIERDLDGSLDLDWQTTGLVCTIRLPSRHVTG